jgi:hypothetical protein
MVTKEGKTCSNDVKPEATKHAKASACSICGKPATQSVDGEPSCADHIEQVYEHQVEDYTRARLKNNEWRKA